MKLLGRVGLLTALASAGAFALPEQYYPGVLKPFKHMINVAHAGSKMLWVYKFSQQDMSAKNSQASEYLKQGLLRNGGIYIKLGQLIATLDIIVPDEYREKMMSLTRHCSQSSYPKIKSIVEEQLGIPIDAFFSKFREEPVSSASIGQVHQAQLKDGTLVAVKIQHDNLLRNVEYDLALMHGCVRVARFLFGQEFKYGWLIEQFDSNIHKELDFTHEAENLWRIEKVLRKENIQNIIVPQIKHPPTKRLLIMEYIHGLHADRVQQIKEAGIDTQQIGRSFSGLITKMIHKYGFVHADPHSGNLLVRKNRRGRDELVLLDHGLYQELDEKTRVDYNWFWLGMILNRPDIYIPASQSLGTKNGILLSCMITGKTRDELQDKERAIFDLNPTPDKSVVLKHAKEWQTEIVDVLNELNRQVLLLLKVNEFARTIENNMGGREMGIYEDIAKCCVQNLPISSMQKLKYYWSMYRARSRSL